MKKITNKEIFLKLEYVFKILFLIYTMISYNGFLFGSKIISVVMWPTFLIGLLIIMWKMIHIKDYVGIPGFMGMACFGLSFAISMLFNYKYEFKQNMITAFFLAFYFGIMYLQKKENKEIEKEFNVIGRFYLVYMTISVICSLILFITHYGKVINVNEDSYEVVTGFVWGRLWGVFLDPNVGAILACIAIAIALFFISKSERKSEKVIYIISIICEVLYIAFSDSRTGRMCLGCLVALEIYCSIYRRIKGRGLKKWVFLLSVCVIIAACSSMAPKGITKIYNSIVSNIDSNANEDNVLIERGYGLSEDPSNRRFDIWKSGLEIFSENWLVGTSYNGIRPYAYEKMPDTYIVNNDSQKFRNLHNEFLNVLAAQGILGLLSVIIMIVPIVILVVNNLFKTKYESNVIKCFFVCVTVVCIGTMLTSAGFFYYVCPYTPMFWIVLGYLQNSLMNGKKCDEEKG
ncbi:O-antigen ligase domain-containing protein [Blautia sp. SG-772]|nr:O-antigen ligase domain-containing protein [Blautia sp. SG-772]